MSAELPRIGHVSWRDLTVPDAESLRDFYCAVVGWTAESCDLGGYSDYSMNAPDGTCVAGVCHARGINAEVPPQWLMYVHVADLERSLAEVTRHGGSLVTQPRSLMGGRFCVIRDPAGAVCALWQAAG